ncbi:adenylate/guanylate cyclase domain-containing protein [Lacinutrix jangbogonensis]|uniref:adenylate/guanylate cyclase domain-containing protein n=1 Tax=Lacinutrix jangbogonensis TaxID=1469557 RepID=UPI00068C759B|nr:adenylate/guanylate cyclase domain-containing protein [Lacinutrix jangbogonensis]
MKFKNKRRWKIIQQYSIGWTLALIFFSIVRGEGTKELGSVQFEFWESIITIFISGPIIGFISGYAQILTEEHSYKRISFQKLLALRLVYVILFLVSIISLGYAVYGENISFIGFAFEPGSFAIYLYIVSVDIFMFGLRQVNLFLGSNNFWKLLRGKFYTPSEEERIFMFIDLQSSTKHAEDLGHIEYSKMIQDCFNDLGIVVENEAEIYQYVGDEVILTWKLQDGLRDENCLNAYFNFKERLDSRMEYYLKNYNCIPHFKAGMNAGIVTVAEVGKFKKEIAYHGDTINTAARIQGKCNELKQDLLISGRLKKELNNTNFVFDKLGRIELKGKESQTLLYAVHKTKNK